MSELLVLPEAAELIGRPVRTLRQWREEGTGPKCRKINGRIMYRRADILQWIDGKFEESK